MVFLIAWLMIINTPLANRWVLGIFILSALTDWLDGYLARRLQQITDFGKFADALADKVLTAGLFVSLAALQRLPESWGLLAVLLIITREFMVTGLRLVAAGRGLVMAAEGLGKFKTLIQMLSIGLFLLLPIIDEKGPIMLEMESSFRGSICTCNYVNLNFRSLIFLEEPSCLSRLANQIVQC